MKLNKVAATITAMITVLIFFSIQGISVVVFELSGAAARFIPALIVWALAAVGFVLLKVFKLPLSEVGFAKPQRGALKRVWYLIPLIAVALPGLVGGVDLSQGISYIPACLLYVSAIAVSEELYFRGIICNVWKQSGYTKAVLVSSALFGACHALQAMANPDLVQTMLAICFAFFYGIAFAQIYLLTKSILPGIIIHAFHDFCSFIGNDVSGEVNLAIGILQTAIIVAFIVVVHFCLKFKTKENNIMNNITIRPEEHKDYKAIVSLILRSFQEGTDYSDGTDIIALVEEIRDSEYYIPELSFVAELDGKIVGHFLFSHFPLSATREGGEKNDCGIVMLAPVSVHADYFRRGIGSSMIKMGIEKVREAGFNGITVEGNFNFYNTVGFRTSSEYNIFPTSGFPMEEPRCMMCQETRDGSLSGVSGYIVYDMYYNA